MRYTVRAQLSVDVEIAIEAASEKEAEALFADNLMVTADLANDDLQFDVVEDSIMAFDVMSVSAPALYTPPVRWKWFPRPWGRR